MIMVQQALEDTVVSMMQFATKFRECFPDLAPANRFLDGTMSSLKGTPRLDPIKLDDAIIAKHGEYKGSMKEFVEKQYGMKAVAFVLQMM